MSADTSGVLQLASNNGTVALTVDTSQNVGIGTTPNAKFEVNGQIRSSGSDARAVYLYGAAGVKPYIDINEYGVGDFFIGAGSTTSGVLSIGPTLASASGININRSGNVGVGTSSPGTTLQLSGSAAFGNVNGTGTVSNGWSVSNTNTSNAFYFAQDNSTGNNFNTGTAYGPVLWTNASSQTFVTNSGSNSMTFASGNLNIGSSTAPNTGSLSNRFLQLVAYGYGSVGTASSNGILDFTCTIAANTATTFLAVADSTKWSGTILISYVRDADQNRSGMKMVRYTYSQRFAALLDDSQNSGATFSVSGNNLQVTIGGAGNYYTQFTIWGGAGP
jgi:hypothetical protein